MSNDCYFSTATGASNIEKHKMFPLCVRYFTHSGGLENKLFDFYESANDTASSMHECIVNILNENCFNLDKISGYTAYKTNMNNGKHNSVFKLLHDSQKKNITIKLLCLHSSQYHEASKRLS